MGSKKEKIHRNQIYMGCFGKIVELYLSLYSVTVGFVKD